MRLKDIQTYGFTPTNITADKKAISFMQNFQIEGINRPINTNTCLHSFAECVDIISADTWKDPANTISFRTALTIENLTEESAPRRQTLVTGPREYQREKVSSLRWKQDLFKTILNDKVAKIPEIHLRSIAPNEYRRYLIELLDGQQRVTTILDYIDGKFPLGKLDGVCGFSVDGLRWADLPVEVKQLILDYRLFAVVYVNITDEDASKMFVHVLNNTNVMNAQEKRNAVRGPLAAYIRNTARFEDTCHDLFTRDFDKRKGHEGEKLMTYFNNTFGVGRMQSDEWLAQMFYLTFKGWTGGVTQSALTNWYETSNAEGGEYQSEGSNKWQKDKKTIDKILDESYRLIKSVDPLNKKRLSNMVALVLCQYYQELKVRYGKVDMKTYTDKFFQVYEDWSCTKKELYKGRLQHDKTTALGQFSKLFGGKNSNAMNTIRDVLEMNITSLDEWGIVEIDPKRTFSEDDKYRKWKEQGGKCYFTNDPIELEDAVADHNIPHAWGVDKGGVTEYDNLIITNQYHNQQKSDKFNAEQYKEELMKV